MTTVRIRDKESFESAMRRLKRAVEKNGTQRELRRREFHEPESTKRQKAAAAAKRRWAKKIAREDLEFAGGASRGGKRGGGKRGSSKRGGGSRRGGKSGS